MEVYKTKSVLQGPSKELPNIPLAQYFLNGFTNGEIQPSNLALLDGEKQQTFQQLDNNSTKIANVILELIQNAPNENPDGDRVIGVCMEPSDKLITVLFGILKAGAAYVPLDITFPKGRISKIVNDCRPLLVICDGKSNVLGKFETVKNLTKILSTGELYEKINSLPENGVTNRNDEVDTDVNDTAIVLYTSGSSGEPKGVRLSHKSILNRLQWQWEQFPFIPMEKCVFKTALTFVDSVSEIFGPLLQGVRLIIFDKTVKSQPPLFMEKLHAFQITRVVVVPSLLRAIFQVIEIVGKSEGLKLLSSVKLWICSGEELSFDLLEEFFEIFVENFTLCNFYGSTEVMGDVTFVSYSSLRDVEMKTVKKRVPIGFPIDNTAIYILGENLELVEQGKCGEIFVAGCNLAKGYVGSAEELDKFVENQNCKLSGFKTFYKTGDFGSIALLPNGKPTLLFEGRTDSQIKVRGQRVDLSEVELIISSLDSISKVKVLCYHPGQSDQAIVAFIVPKTTQTTENQLNQEIHNHLRDYERPVIRLLEEIPLLVNGKTDKQRLLRMFAAEQKNGEEYDDWNSLKIPEEKLPIAKNLFEIISAVTGLSIQTIVENIDDSFYNIGGTSLNTVVVIVKLKEMGHFISISDFTSAKTIREILMRIISQEENELAIQNHLKSNKNYEKYSVSFLRDDDKVDVVHIISISFARKGDLEAYVNVTYKDFPNLITSIWNALVEKNFSFIVRKTSNGEAVAVGLNFDVYDEPSEWQSSTEMNYVMEMLESVESQQRGKLPQGKGKLLHSFMMGVAEDVEDSERVSLVELMEEQNLLIAKKNKFEGIFTTNSNPLTTQIGRDLYGYEVLNEFQINEYVAPDGVKPFALAPNSFKIVCCWKRLL